MFYVWQILAIISPQLSLVQHTLGSLSQTFLQRVDICFNIIML